MKRKKRVFLLIIQLLIVLVLLSAIVVVNYVKDKIPPVISIEQEALILTEEEIEGILEGNLDVLMEGVTAVDNIEGDITDRIFIFSITPKQDNLYAIVNYRVLDSADNVGHAKRIAYLKTPEEIHKIVMERYRKQQEPEKTQDFTHNDEGNTNNSQTNSVSKPPVIKLRDEAVITVGEQFDPTPYVIEFSDDKDSVQELTQNVTVEGELDTNIPGRYVLTFYVTDSDGNVSEPSSITVIVE